MARCGDGLAAGSDLVEAARAAVALALAPLDGARADLVMIFVAGDDPDACEAALRAGHDAADARTTVGCSAVGVIGGGRAAIGVPAVSAWAASLPGARVRSFHLEVLRTKDAWAVVGMPVPRGEDVVGTLFADPWSFPVEGFVAASHDATASLPLVGGMASGPTGAGSTRLMVNGAIHDRGAVGAAISGVGTRTLVSPGHRPFGPPMTVTGAIGATITALAGAPASERLAAAVAALSPADQVLADRGVMLGIAIDEYLDDHGAEEVVVRSILDVDDLHGSLDMPDPVRVGTTVRFCLVDPHAASSYFMDSLVCLRAESDRLIDGAVMMACADRYAGAFDVLDDDVNALTQVLGASGVAGMLSGGEIGPAGGENHVHGLSSTVLTVAANVVVNLTGDPAASRPSAGSG